MTSYPWDDLNTLPYVLVGPVLRQVDLNSVTVWFAARAAGTAALHIQALGGSQDLMTSAPTDFIQVGVNLYVVAVTAGTPSDPDSDDSSDYQSGVLQEDTTYQYDVSFTFGGVQGKLRDPMILTVPGAPVANGTQGALVDPQGNLMLTYGGTTVLPTFKTMPDSWRSLRLLHGSCRKAHGPGFDALVRGDNILDGFLNPAPQYPPSSGDVRPHVMFHTGDQIYADDVANVLLSMLMMAGPKLVQPNEVPIPGLSSFPMPSGGQPWYPPIETSPGSVSMIDLLPGLRSVPAVSNCHFTSDYANSHLFTLSEFFCMYLFAWSNVLWPPNGQWPQFSDVYPNPTATQLLLDAQGSASNASFRQVSKIQSEWIPQQNEVLNFYNALPQVRRFLANIPNYMICDDHEVTDDWNISAGWVQNVYAANAGGTPLPGRFVVRNAMIAYVLFQAWGNTPAQFTSGEMGNSLLTALDPGSWNGEADPDIENMAGLPPVGQPLTTYNDQFQYDGNLVKVPVAIPVVNRTTPPAVRYNYWLNRGSYQIIVMDTRTWRAYPDSARPFQEGQNNAATLNPAFLPCQQLPNIPASGSAAAEGFDSQISDTLPSNPEDIELTIVVSPCVPKHVPPVETLQSVHAPRAVTYLDIEGWSDYIPAREQLLSRLAMRLWVPGRSTKPPDPQRIIILSGDVHMGYAARFDYVAGNPYRADVSAFGFPFITEVIFACFTSSALKNSGNLNLAVQNASTKGPPPVDLFGRTLITLGKTIVDQTNPNVGLPDYVAQYSVTPNLDDQTWWHNYRMVARDVQVPTAVLPSSGGQSESKSLLGQVFSQLVSETPDALSSKFGAYVLGETNIGDITFGYDANDDDCVYQRLWWTSGNQLIYTRFPIPWVLLRS